LNIETYSSESSHLNAVVEKYAGRRRDALLPMLHDVQAIFGWLSRESQEVIGKTLRVPLAEIHGVIEFYSMFYNQPTPSKVIRLCEDPACHLAGADEVANAFNKAISKNNPAAGFDNPMIVEQVPCLGMCEHAPVGLMGTEPMGNLQTDSVTGYLEGKGPVPMAKVFGRTRLITERIGTVDPLSLDDYKIHGGFEVLRSILKMNPDDLINEVEQSGILGRGGAMFPLGRKWRFTRAAHGELKFVIVNGDESEPGTFKDRCLMEEDPFAVIEAATVAGYAIGAQKGWIFVRGEYSRAYTRLDNAVKMARKNGYLGRNILNLGFDFDIEMRLGAGAYICGEETALFSAIEGMRGFPRIKPPFPVTHGLFNRPTAINNVETLVTVLAALKIGIDSWQTYGTKQSPGTKLFCVSGHVKQPGLYELPFGFTVQELIKLAGGVQGGTRVQAVLLGGAAGTFLGPQDLDLELNYEDARLKEVPLGSGVIMVFNENADLRKTLYQLSRFFAHESCGKCFPCQLGTQRQKEILAGIANGAEKRNSNKRDLIDIGHAMTETSLCGLGQTASSAILSAIDIWPELVE
jgi:NADH-quinone oxidoreductase subunit F